MATPEPQEITVEIAGTQVRLRWHPIEAGLEVASPPDWDRLEGIRLVSAAFEDGAALAVATIRPRDARGHGDDAVTARFVDADGLQITTSEALVSVEYDPTRRPRRIGVEVWPESDSPPLRIAADRRQPDEGSESSDIVPMSFRRDGVGGHGAYETIRQS